MHHNCEKDLSVLVKLGETLSLKGRGQEWMGRKQAPGALDW